MTTNAQVAARFASAVRNIIDKPMRSLGVGTNMSARNPTLSQSRALNLESFGHFDLIALGYSYSTEVVQLVLNNHTDNVELWTHVNGFSPTTRRHKSLYLQAFHLEMQKQGKTTEEITSRIFRTGCFEGGYRTRQKWNGGLEFNGLTKPHRAEACQYGMDYDSAMEDLETAAIRPRLHDATRLTLLDHARVHLRTCIRNVSDGIHPQSAVASHFDNPEFMTACHDLMTFIDSLETMPIKQMRATVAGYVALNKN